MIDKALHQITGEDRLSKYVVSDYLGSGQLELDTDYPLTIDKLWQGIISTGGKPEQQIVISFRERTIGEDIEVKPMILNATNRRTLKKLYGGDSAKVLEGKGIYVYVETGVKDPRGGGTTEGLRIRFKKPAPPKGKAFTCADCGETVKDSGGFTAAQIAGITQKRYDVVLCAGCSAKRKAASTPAQEESTDDSDT